MRMWVRSVIFVLCSAAAARASGEGIRVATSSGLVEGTLEGKALVFKGLPFAMPPTGELRWRPPAPPRAWRDVLTADTFKPMCMTAIPAIPGGPMEAVSEDCLYLNVWTPAERTGQKLPVMVWIYGGGMRAGSASAPAYSGRKLVEYGVVTVNLSYRVGSLGFLSHPGLSEESGYDGSGNYGVMDAIAALQWIQKNIAAFGGDPDNVTIFGQSAGSMMVGYLMTTPLARGLFHRAIGQSGADMGPLGGGMMRLADAEASGIRFSALLNAKSIVELRHVPADRILAMDGRWPADERGNIKPGSTAVRDGHVFQDTMYDTFSAGRQNDVPLLVGYNDNEGASFVWEPVHASSYTANVRREYGELAEDVLRMYPASTDQEATQSQKNLIRDNWYAWPAWTWARLQSTTGHAKVHFYKFSHTPMYPVGSPVTAAGAAHGSELAHIFGREDHLPPTATLADRRMVDVIAKFWTNFARTGDPNGPTLPRWPAFNVRHERIMNFAASASGGELSKSDRNALELQERQAFRARTSTQK